MIFNPQESIDFHGFTGPFVQYTHAHIARYYVKPVRLLDATSSYAMTSSEKGMLKIQEQYAAVLLQAAHEYNPSLICNYVFQLAKTYNAFLVDHSILKADSDAAKTFRFN